MSNERITPTEITIKDKKKTFKGKVVKAAVFTGSKIIHVRTTDHENFYLLYFKNSLLFGDKLEQISESSFVHKAFQDGMVIEESHPILPALIPNDSITIPNRGKLFAQLQSHYSPQEAAYIATTLDSFFEKNLLVKFIEDIYFGYRRNGKFMKAFQVSQILTEFMPQLKSAKERLSSLEFKSYFDFYHSASLPSIFNKDPLYVELYCYKNRFHPDVSPYLEEILSSKECFLDILLLWLEKARKLNSIESIEKYTNIALKSFTFKEWTDILCRENINPFSVLPGSKQMIEKMLREGNYETAASSLLNFIDVLPSSYDSILEELWGKLDVGFIVSHLDQFTAFLKNRAKEETRSEPQIFQLIVSMLNGDDVKTVYEKLLPLQNVLPQSAGLKKLATMVNILEDPDRMMELGDCYAEFKQYDSAIDCFFWEMELNPQDPNPIRKISKMYQQKGKVKEAAAYQKVLAQLKNSQKSV